MQAQIFAPNPDGTLGLVSRSCMSRGGREAHQRHDEETEFIRACPTFSSPSSLSSVQFRSTPVVRNVPAFDGHPFSVSPTGIRTVPARDTSSSVPVGPATTALDRITTPCPLLRCCARCTGLAAGIWSTRQYVCVHRVWKGGSVDRSSLAFTTTSFSEQNGGETKYKTL
jgi:hypothetical protein